MASLGSRCCTCVQILFSILLIVGLFLLAFSLVLVHLPYDKESFSSTDMRSLKKSSSIMCSSTFIKSNFPFNLYKTPRHPEISQKERRFFNLKFDETLNKDDIVLYRYYMLEGSELTLSACGSNQGSSIMIVRGEKNLKECLRELNWSIIMDEHNDLSPEKNEIVTKRTWKIESLPDRKTFPNKQGARCKASLIGMDISTGCNSQNLRVETVQNDPYFIVLDRNDQEFGTSHVTLKVSLNKTNYELNPTEMVCQNATSCRVSMAFGESASYIAYMPLQPSAGRYIYAVETRCRARFLFFSFILVLVPLIILIGSCSYSKKKATNYRAYWNNLRLFSSDNKRVSKQPLLRDESPEITIYDREVRPPPYQSISTTNKPQPINFY